MAHIYRIVFFLIFVLFFAVGEAQASGPFITSDSYTGTVANLMPQENCNRYYPPGFSTATLTSGTDNKIGANYQCGQPYYVSVTIVGCQAPYINVDGACVKPPSVCDWAAGTTQLVFGTFYIERGKQLCVSGCAFNLRSDAGVAADSKRLNATSPWQDQRTMGDFVGTGQECSSDVGASTGGSTPSTTAPPVIAPPASKCPDGKVPGQVNGVDVCVTPGETKTGSGTTESTTDSSGKNTTEKTDKQTSCDASTCTTTITKTTTETSADGTVGTPTITTSTVFVARGDFCKANPKEVACGGNGSATGGSTGSDGTFSGVCGAEPACTGDAVQCAQATYAFKTACALTTPPTDAEQAVFNTAAGRAAGDVTGDLTGNTTVAFNAGMLDQTELLGSGSGLSDLNITVAGHTTSIPFSMLNVWFRYLGYVLVAVTFLLCIRIVTRG